MSNILATNRLFTASDTLELKIWNDGVTCVVLNFFFETVDKLGASYGFTRSMAVAPDYKSGSKVWQLGSGPA